MITGRSDATLNRGGVRLGRVEIYSVVEEIDEVLDSLVVHLEEQDELLLFVVLRPGLELDDELRKRIAGALRNSLSPRHAPDTIVAVPAIPRTLTGKKLEVPVKRILTGADVSQVASATRWSSRAPSSRSRSTRGRASSDHDQLMVSPRLQHVLVLTDDLDATRTSTAACSGSPSESARRSRFPGYWLYSDGVACLHVAERASYDAHAAGMGLPAKASPVDHVAFETDGHEVLVERLAAAGIEVTTNAVPGSGMRQLFFDDPNGARIELVVSE